VISLGISTRRFSASFMTGKITEISMRVQFPLCFNKREYDDFANVARRALA
jgi:hypothetical protein